MLRRARITWMMVAVWFLSAFPGTFAKCQLDLTSPETMLRTGQCFGFYSEAPIPKKRKLERVAIVSFQVRYELRSGTGAPVALALDGERTAIDDARTNFFDLTLDDFNRITSELHDDFRRTLEAGGIRTVEVEQIKATEFYAKLKQDDAVLFQAGRYARGAAHGMKNLKPRPTDANIQKLAGISHDLGVDASLAVFVTVGLGDVEGGAVTPTIGPQQEGPLPMEVNLVGGFLDQKVPGGGVSYIPQWRTRFGVQRATRERLVYRESLGPLVAGGVVFEGGEYGDDVGSYVTGVRTLVGIAGKVALAYGLATK